MKYFTTLIPQPHIHQESRLSHGRTDNRREVAISKRPEGDSKTNKKVLPSEVYSDHGEYQIFDEDMCVRRANATERDYLYPLY